MVVSGLNWTPFLIALRLGDISLFMLLCLAAATRADLGGGGYDCLKEIVLNQEIFIKMCAAEILIVTLFL